MARMIFPNLPVADAQASRTFFEALGFEINETFSDETTVCVVVNELACVMLLERERFAGFVTRPQPDPTATTGSILTVSAEDRAGVDTLADAALAAGATKAKDPMDMGFMYGRSFLDLDGHHWEVMHMDPAAVENGPDA